MLRGKIPPAARPGFGANEGRLKKKLFYIFLEINKPPMQPTLLQGIQYIISCNSLLVEGGGNKYKGAGLPLYLAKLVAHYSKKMQFYRTI